MSTASYLEVERKNVPPTPWKAIFTSAPALALFATLVSNLELNVLERILLSEKSI